MPFKFWDEAFLTTVFLINRLPSPVIDGDTPLNRLYKQEPDYTFLRTFGCAVWPNLRPFNTRKLQFHSKRCVFIGYSNAHKGFKCLDPKEGRVYISRDVVFDEYVFPFAELHPNAGSRLRAEFRVLLDALRSQSSIFGDAHILDQRLQSPNPTDVCSSSCNPVQATERNLMPNDAGTGEIEVDSAPYFMCHRGGGNTAADADLPDTAATSNLESPPGLVSTDGSAGLSGEGAELASLGAGSSAPTSASTIAVSGGNSPHHDPATGGQHQQVLSPGSGASSNSAASLAAPEPSRPATRLQHGIVKP